MANNIGTIGITLSSIIGDITTITNPALLTSMSGSVDIGFIAFDSRGTMGVCTAIATEGNNIHYSFRTCSVNQDVDIQDILSQSY